MGEFALEKMEEFYSRQIAVPSIGLEGQNLLSNASIVIVGCGGLCAGVLPSVAGCGIGKIILVDGDKVESTNLHRQTIHAGKVGRYKAESAAEYVALLNPYITVEPISEFLSPDNAVAILSKADLVYDCTDNLPIRRLISDAVNQVVERRVPVVSGSALQLGGQVLIYGLRKTDTYRTLLGSQYPAAKEMQERGGSHIEQLISKIKQELEGPTQSCASAGVFGPLPQLIGHMMAVEGERLLLGWQHPSYNFVTLDMKKGLGFRYFTLHERKDEAVNPWKPEDYTRESCAIKRASQSVNTLSWREMLDSKNACLIDVRPDEISRRQSSGIPKERVIMMSMDSLLEECLQSLNQRVLTARLREIVSKHRCVITFCRRGITSVKAAYILDDTLKVLEGETPVRVEFINQMLSRCTMQYHWSPRRLSSISNTEQCLIDGIGKKIKSQATDAMVLLKQKDLEKPLATRITPQSILGGMRGLPLMLWETSKVDPQEGIKYRDLPLSKVIEKLPKPEGARYPSAEAVFHFLLTGNTDGYATSKSASPSLECIAAAMNANEIDEETILRATRAVNITEDSHPMTQFINGLIAAQNESLLAEQYSPKMSPDKIMEASLIDGCKLLAFLPVLTGYVYRKSNESITPEEYIKEIRSIIEQNPQADWCARLVRFMGLVKSEPQTNKRRKMAGEFSQSSSLSDALIEDTLRLFILTHADHEGGNVSAHVSHIVASAHADIFYSYIAAMCGLAGPLHGLANQESLGWQTSIFRQYVGAGNNGVLDERVKNVVLERVKEDIEKGSKIPGFGHAVLRTTDPRYLLFREYGEDVLMQELEDEEMLTRLRFNHFLADGIPQIMKEYKKIKSPWPNVDHGTGVVLSAIGIKERRIYTTLFGLSRALGITASNVWSRALKLPIERPKSTTIQGLIDQMEQPN